MLSHQVWHVRNCVIKKLLVLFFHFVCFWIRDWNVNFLISCFKYLTFHVLDVFCKLISARLLFMRIKIIRTFVVFLIIFFHFLHLTKWMLQNKLLIKLTVKEVINFTFLFGAYIRFLLFLVSSLYSFEIGRW